MTEHNHDWYVDLIPAYAIGAADPEERAEVDAHLSRCAECRLRVDEYRVLTDELAFSTLLAPAPVGLTEDLRKRIGLQTARAPWRTWLGFLRRPAFVLAITALALLVLTNVYWVGRVGKLERQARDFTALAQAPGITLRASDGSRSDYGGRSADGVVYVQPGSNVALLCVYALPRLDPGKTYQAWLLSDGQRVSAGTFAVNNAGYGVLLIDADRPVSEFQQLGITVEPAGGSPAPTTPRVMGGEL